MQNQKQKNLSSWQKIKPILGRASDIDLIGIIKELYSLSKANEDFLNAKFLRNSEIVNTYKKQIKSFVGPSEPWKSSQQISLKDAKKILSNYKKATGDKTGLADLMIYYVECGTSFICEYGDMYEAYYASLESVFENALKIMKELDNVEDVQNYTERLKKVIQKANHTGWGYYDTLAHIFKKYEKL